MRFFVFLWGKGWEWGEKRKKSLTNNGKKVRLLQAFFVCLAQTARGWVRMLIAYNNDIEFRSRWYHIQTEDNGIKDGHVTTTVFFSGQILDSKTTSYLDAINGAAAIDNAASCQNASHRFVIEIANLRHPRFESMAKRRMTNIVQQCRRARHGSLETIAAWIGTVEHALGDVLSPNRMTKSRVFCAVVDEIRQTELTDSAQSLNDIGIDEGK